VRRSDAVQQSTTRSTTGGFDLQRTQECILYKQLPPSDKNQHTASKG